MLFHIDGDRTWTERSSSENVGLFQERVVAPVQQILKGTKSTSKDAETRLHRLFSIVPFYSIEAWLYQHTDVAIRLCRERYRGRDLARFKAWARDRAALDDVEKPKNEICLKNLHNLECAGPGYPAQAVFDAGRSYAECVLRLQECAELRALLNATAGRFEVGPLE